MPIKTKLALAFSSVLLLTVVVAMTNLWGMGKATRQLDEVYNLTSKAEMIFQEIIINEKAFLSTNQRPYSRSVIKSIAQLRTTILHAKFSSESPDNSGSIQQVLESLKDYESNFLKVISSALNMQTMKSRMLSESRRLLANAEKLTLQDTDGSGQTIKQTSSRVLYLIGNVLLHEKEFLLTGKENGKKTVAKLIQEIKDKTAQIQNDEVHNNTKLSAYRVSKVSSIYLAIYNNLRKERQLNQQASKAIQDSQKTFAESLNKYLNNQRVETQQLIATLQLISISVSISAILIGAIAVIVLARVITSPIEKLKDSAQRIVDGNLESKVSVTTKDDIGELGILFNKMTNRLSASFNDIESYRDHLEELVKERTRNLQEEVSERRLTEEALRASSEQLANILNQSPIGVIIFDTEFNITQWNPSCEKIFGFTREEIVGTSGFKIVPDESQEHVVEIFSSLIKNKVSLQSCNENFTKQQNTITCKWYNTPLTDSYDRIIGMLSLVEDVTDQLKLEGELLKAKKLESTGILAGGIAHDFNNILTAILGNINLSLQDSSLKCKTRKILDAAEKASIRAQALTQQLLTFAKGGEPVKEHTSAEDLIRDSANFILHGSATSCSYRFPENLWYINADKGQISQVIQNIVLNSSQAMPDGGKLEITCGNIEGNQEESELLDSSQEYVKITIQDSGIGIPDHVIENVFDPYFSTKKEGSGLGLAITLSIITKHKGRILVNSEPELGTTFTIYIPAIKNHHPQTNIPESDLQQAQRPATILIMDDEEMVLQVTGSMIKELGHKVLLARDGDECITLYQHQSKESNPIDLILMDLTIPGGKGGEETIKKLLDIDPDIHVIVSSGYSNDPIMANYEKYGFAGAIAKPYIMNDLATHISAFQSDSTLQHQPQKRL